MENLGYLLAGIGNTLIVTAAAFVIGAILGLPLVAARSSRNIGLRSLSRAYVELMRAVPPLVWLFLVFFGLPEVGLAMSPLNAAILTFGLVASSYLSEIYRSGLSAIGSGQWEASAAVGLSRFDTVRSIIVPQVLRVIGPTTATYAIGLLKDSALASTIGVVELTFRGRAEVQRTGDGLEIFAVIGVVYLLLSLPLAVVSRSVDSRLRARFSVS